MKKTILSMLMVLGFLVVLNDGKVVNTHCNVLKFQDEAVLFYQVDDLGVTEPLAIPLKEIKYIFQGPQETRI